uniref:armadillo repeat containing 1, like isoform X2 n=1 Tax=Oncorhynchus gorbuscha TaxID=8017 RepID=UPI001EAF5ABB|nr:armadillo repeat containing 1, like isoform X2 [Oncorhynchus gorbuscha]XP_046146955.1 armadillo repeat containing 1, like isoform X2 [Oncorhynchus gorbuscha]XP_046146956.1 armadillo repeat containing 1, like isoform X2 [Oncorhynchus gorbuscha]
MMDALSVVTQLRDLASEPQNREAIVQDQGCLPGLVLFLDHQDPQVLFATLQTMRYLAEWPLNVTTMKNELGMMVSLVTLMERSGLCDDINTLSREVYGILSAPPTPAPPSPEKERRRNKPQFFLNSSKGKNKSVTLHIQGLDSTAQRGVCEEALLKVKGVISFTFQMASKRCTVRIRSDLPTESLASAIAATKVLSAQQVVRNEVGDEVLLPLSVCGGNVREENVSIPDYLPEDESPESETDRAVSRTAAKDNTSGSWLGSAATFLTRSFYW